MAKRRKKRKKRRVKGIRGASQVKNPKSALSQSPETSLELSERLRIEAEEKYRRKQVRRQVSQTFHEMCTRASKPDLEEIVAVLSDHFSELDLVREALQPQKHSQNPWYTEIWRILDSEDPETTAKILLAQRQEIIDAQKELLQQHVPDPLVVQVATTADGPAFHEVTPELLHRLIMQYVRAEEESVEFDLGVEDAGAIKFSRPGEYQLKLIFLNGDTLPLRLRLELELDDIPADCKRAWEQADSIEVTPDTDVPAQLQDHLGAVPADDPWVWYLEASRVLKTAHGLGYWRASWAQRLLEEWREKSQRVLLETSSRDSSVGEGGIHEMTGVHVPVERSASKEEAQKLRILDLPPLVRYDLRTSSVDLVDLQPLFRIPHLRSLKRKDLKSLTKADIRRLSDATYYSVKDLGRGKYGGPVGARALAMMLRSVARLQFEKLEIGSCESSIRFCLSGYSTRLAAYLIEQHSRYDSAHDYYLEAVTLNLVSGRGVDFPTTMLFRSCFPGTRIRSNRPTRFLELLTESRWYTEEVLESLTRSFMELGSRHYRWAEQWFRQCPDNAQQWVLSAVKDQLGLGEASLSNCVAAYKQGFGRLQALLKYMQQCNSSQGILSLAPAMVARLQELSFLLSPTNREIAQLLIEAADAVRGFVQSSSYEDKRNYVNTAKNLLERVLAYGADNRTALWAAHFGQIAEHWLSVLQQEFSAIARDIAPVLEVCLAEKAMSLSEDGQARVIFRIENSGAGTADPVNVRFHPTDAECKVALPNLRDLRLEPGEAVESYFNLETYSERQHLSFNFEVSYYDPDRLLRERTSERPLLVQPLQDNEQLQQLWNPFRTDKEVDDERMFVGRDQLLDEVCEYAASEPHGGLLMLHGQKRVGKSSLQLFMERRIDEAAQANKVLAVRVSWLDFSRHTAAGVIEELILGIRQKYRHFFGDDLPVPSRDEIQESYSLAFNDVLRGLESHGVSRLVLLVDEFDVIVNQLDGKLGFDRMFFEYLRGLSKRESMALVLTGGEMMPLLFDRLGEVFNHDRTWRIAYLSPTDGSVEKLVQNDYVRDYLHFSSDAIAMIKEVSACNPCFVQMICQEIVERSRRQRSAEVCKLDVQEAAEWLVRQAPTTKYVRHLYCPLQEPDSLDLAIIGITAEEETLGHRPRFVPQQKIVQRIQEQYSDRVVAKIGELARREIVRRNPENSEEIRIMLPLFRDWFNDNKPEYSLWAPLLRR